MKHSIGHHLLIGLLLLVASVSLFSSTVLAVSGTVSFSPPGGTVIEGEDFTVEVRGNVPDPGFWGGGATVVVNYDSTKLEVVDRNDTGGAFRGANSRVWTGTTAGTVRYVAYYAINAPGVDNQKIISIKFRPLATGSTVLSFGSETNVNNGPTTGTPNTFTVIPKNCPAGQTGTPPNCITPAPTPSPTVTPTPTKTPIPTKTPTPKPSPTVTPTPTVEETPAPIAQSDGGLKIENVKTVPTRQKNTVTWSLNSTQAEPKLTYGLTRSTLKSEAIIKKLSDGTYEATLADTKLGTLYYFAIKASTPDQLQGATYNGTITTKGLPVQLTIKQNGVLAPDARVKIGERSFVSNKDALITTELSDGSYEASITPSGSDKSYPSKFVVKNITIPVTGEPKVQSFTLDVTIEGNDTAPDDSSLALIIGGIIATLLGLGGLIGFLLYRRNKQNEPEESVVDGDLLIANYGPSIEDSRSQTPEPNLDVQNASMGYTPPLPDFTQVSEQQSYTNTAAQTVTESYQTPVALDQSAPTDPVQQAPVLDAADSTEYTELPQAMQEEVPPVQVTDEQLQEPVVAVESIERDTIETAPSQEEAIYHPETGELDIIHTHHTSPNPTTYEQSIPLPSLSPPNQSKVAP